MPKSLFLLKMQDHIVYAYLYLNTQSWGSQVNEQSKEQGRQKSMAEFHVTIVYINLTALDLINVFDK